MCDTLRDFILELVYAINYVWGLGCYRIAFNVANAKAFKLMLEVMVII